jgi:hypothetical protein
MIARLCAIEWRETLATDASSEGFLILRPVQSAPEPKGIDIRLTRLERTVRRILILMMILAVVVLAVTVHLF